MEAVRLKPNPNRPFLLVCHNPLCNPKLHDRKRKLDSSRIIHTPPHWCLVTLPSLFLPIAISVESNKKMTPMEMKRKLRPSRPIPIFLLSSNIVIQSCMQVNGRFFFLPSRCSCLFPDTLRPYAGGAGCQRQQSRIWRPTPLTPPSSSTSPDTCGWRSMRRMCESQSYRMKEGSGGGKTLLFLIARVKKRGATILTKYAPR